MQKTLQFIVLITFIFLPNNIYSQDFDFFESETTIGGYGELHYNYMKPENGQSSQMLDFHRFVLFVGHSFSEKWSFKSEVELEHNIVEEDQGALELEQAYINYHFRDWLGFQAGVILPSAGLLNEFHEPPLFLSVERPEYNKVIIPTTWFGNGVSAYGNVKGFDYKFTVLEGLNADGFSPSSGIRGGRQQGFKSDAEKLLYNFRLDYLGFPGLKIGASYSYNNAKGDSINNAINLAEFHGQYVANNFFIVFEFGNISFDKGMVESARGFYTDLGYNVGSFFEIPSKIYPFVRYSDINTAASTTTGGNSEEQYHFTKIMFGVSILPIPNVSIKFDYSTQERELGNAGTNRFNLGVGYMF